MALPAASLTVAERHRGISFGYVLEPPTPSEELRPLVHQLPVERDGKLVFDLPGREIAIGGDLEFVRAVISRCDARRTVAEIAAEVAGAEDEEAAQVVELVESLIEQGAASDSTESRRRFEGGASREARFPFLPRETIEHVQRRRVRAAVAHAHQHVPYYRETMRRLGLSPEDLATAADLAKLPVIQRDDLQRDPEYFCSDRHPPSACREARTGGSTGEPVTIFRHPSTFFAESLHLYRLRTQLLRLAGRRDRLTMTGVFLPRAGTGGTVNRVAPLPLRPRDHRTELSILEPLEVVAEQIERIAPDVIFTYGSYLEALFDHLAAAGRRTFPARLAMFTGDALGESSRRLIQERFGIETLGIFMANEAPLVGIGFECDHHRGYHQNIDLCPIRVVNERGGEATPGETGEVILSNLVAAGTVLLNYRLGDLCASVDEPCGCGRNLPLISYVQGRSTEWLLTESGKPLHGLAIRDLMRRRQDILRYQVVQRSRDRVEATLVTAPRCNAEEIADWIRASFAERLGPSIQTEVSFATDLPRTAAGKTLPVISELEPFTGSRFG